MRKHRHLGFADIQFNRRSDPIRLCGIGLGHPSRLFDHAHKLPGTAVGDGGLAGVQLDDRIVDAGAGQCRQHMLDGMHLDPALAESRGALCIDNVFGARLDLRSAIEIDATEPQTGVGQGRQEVHRNSVSAVETDSGKGDRLLEGVLGRHGRLF